MATQADFCFGTIGGKDNGTFMLQAKANGLFRKTSYMSGLLTVTDLQQQAKTIERNVVGITRAPFFALRAEPVMQRYIALHQQANGPNTYPSDWACMHLDALYALDQAAAKAGTIDKEALRAALTGATIDTCRGKATFATCSNQLDIPAGFVGTVTDTPEYPFPVYDPKSLIRVDAKEVARSCEQVSEGRKRRT
jgi:branched-chain amino acid transport system substrate-binding protein